MSACKVHLEEGRYTWRHNSILKAIGDYLASARKDINLFCDIDGYKSLSIITGDQLRPDMVITDASSDSIFVVELTVGFETRIRDNAVRKSNHYKDLCNQLKNHYSYVKFINLSMRAIGVLGKSSRCFYKLLMNDLKLDETHNNFLVRKIISCCIRTTYYLFCMKDKEWPLPQLLLW